MREIGDRSDKKVAQFILFAEQNKGVFPKGRRAMFQELSDGEILALTAVVNDELLSVMEQK